ncbi:T9SS type A sorting domain-containing protein [Flavobacteriaceae bacterium R38]|nr:T9SS type A sorting domain-containing protein [Flavobacteriaceae bacterium R38]
MKKLVLIALIATSFTYGQLHVSSGSFIYADSIPLFIGDFGDTDADINLAGTTGDYTPANNGYIFLRNQSQIFQTLSSNSTANTGLGKISMYQEGTSDEYDYNYWGSPVHDPEGSAFNVTLGFYDPATDDLNPTAATIINGFDGNASPLLIADRWIFKYEQGVNTNGFTFVTASRGGDDLVAQGLGFTMKGTQGGAGANPTGTSQQYDFRGRPNTGDITVQVALDYTLVGNPYPSALNLQDFLTDPDNLPQHNGNAYFWQQDRSTNSHRQDSYIGGYGTYVPLPGDGAFVQAVFSNFDSAGNPIDIDGDPMTNPTNNDQTLISRKFIPPGQGFFVFGDSLDISTPGIDRVLTFKNSHRDYRREDGATPEAVFQGIEKIDDLNLTVNNSISNTQNAVITTPNTEEESVIKDYSILHFNIGIINDNLNKPISLSFYPQGTDDFDKGAEGYDLSFLRNNVYWSIKGRENPFNIQGTNYEENKVVPLTFNVTDPNVAFEISILEKEFFSDNISVYFLDKETNSFMEITNESHEFTIEEPGIYKDRFAITFVGAPETNEEGDDTAEDDSDDDSNDDDDVIAEDLLPEVNTEFVAFQDNLNKQIIIQNNGSLNINTITLYDVSGKILFTDTKNSSDQFISYGTGQYSTGVYILSVVMSDNEVITKKIAISN